MKLESEYYKELKANNLILFECIVGSQAYGTNIATSDVDKKFVYIEPLDKILNHTFISQLNVNKDYTGYEIGRYLELLQVQNPTILELLWADDKSVEYIHPLFESVIKQKRSLFLSKKIYYSFGKYAQKQIEKARGLNKKIVNPMEGPRKGLLDFCWVGNKQGSKSLKEWLQDKGYDPTKCGCVAIDHMKNCFHLFFDLFNIYTKDYKGITDKDDVQIVLSSVEKGTTPDTLFYCNIEGFSKYCKDYREYMEWEENRNPERYQQNIDNGSEYDSKNMMHCVRLLETAIEGLDKGKINVFRPNADWLLDIRKGTYSYDQILEVTRLKIERLEVSYKCSTLPEEIEKESIDNLLLEFRKKFYQQ